MTINVTLCNKARLRAAEWLVWAADIVVTDSRHRVLDIVWVNPETLEIYIDVATVRRLGCWNLLEEADNRLLFNAYSEQHTGIMAEKFANAKGLIVPIRCILRDGIHNLSSKNDDSVTLRLFFYWLVKQGRKPDEVYEELWQKCHIRLDSPFEWGAVEYDEYEYIEVLDHDEQMVTFLRNQPVYDEVIDRIEENAYHIAVKTAMDAISTTYDHNQWLT